MKGTQVHPAAETERTILGYRVSCPECGQLAEPRYRHIAGQVALLHDRELRDINLARGEVIPAGWTVNRDGYRERTVTVWRVFLQDPANTSHPQITLETVQHIETQHHDGITRGTAFNFTWDGDPERIARYILSGTDMIKESARIINSRTW